MRVQCKCEHNIVTIMDKGGAEVSAVARSTHVTIYLYNAARASDALLHNLLLLFYTIVTINKNALYANIAIAIYIR